MYYETPIERFWDHLKVAAALCAASGKPVPENGECRKIVLAESHGISLSDDLVDYYAQEFCRMVHEKIERLGD